MKGLLLKDIMLLKKQCKWVLFLIAVYMIVPVFSETQLFLPLISVLLCSMLPSTLMGLDEKSGWNQLVVCMPCSRQEIVLEKYIIGILGAVSAGLLIFLTYNLGLWVRNAAFEPSFAGIAAAVVGIAFFYLAINLPLLFKFGTEKGRLWGLLTVMVLCGTAGGISVVGSSQDLLRGGTNLFLVRGGLLILMAGVLVLALSARISIMMMKKKDIA